MSEIPLNKFGKRDLVIKLLKEGHTYRDIAHIAHISVRDIKPILKKHEQQLENTKRKKNNNQQETTTKKLSLSSQAFTLFKEDKKLDEVKVLLDIPFKKAMLFWKQYLKSKRMYECFEFYEIFQNDLPTLLPISNFIKRNNVSGKDILHVLRTANDVIQLRAEMKRLEQVKNNYLLNQNTNYLPLPRLGLPEYYYRY